MPNHNSCFFIPRCAGAGRPQLHHPAVSVGAIHESPWAGLRQIPAGLHEAGKGEM